MQFTIQNVQKKHLSQQLNLGERFTKLSSAASQRTLPAYIGLKLVHNLYCKENF